MVTVFIKVILYIRRVGNSKESPYDVEKKT